MQYTIHDGETLVKAARNSIELFLKSPKFENRMIERHIERFTDRRGVFVTIKHYPTMSLRGCIGFPKPVAPLKELVIEAAIAAAAEDPRFVPLSQHELGESVIEVSVLHQPELISETTAKGRMNRVRVGRDGLIIHYGFKSGLLLPVVPIEEGWNTERFLSGVCEKAGLNRDSWKRPEISLYKFTAQVFRESEPEGIIEEMPIG
ncbi:MAG: TIGR00296 family protein [Candidatus Marsarchaeota archaeon]|nr:TIGR00296 family protein [Candidatus Marsarchaeota archaeon]MCL5413144.1 TIGR00296 family protein [Candidatus Marsarchaeota archaeon]